MDNDIVTRLRGLACPECGLPSTHNHFDEAADEIERLQTLLDETLKRENKDNERQLDTVREVEANRDMWRNALLHGVANLDNLCKGCAICEFIKSKHEEVGGMRGATFDSPK